MDNIVQVSTVSPQILAATLHACVNKLYSTLHEGESTREEKKGNSPFLHLFPSLLPSLSSSSPLSFSWSWKLDPTKRSTDYFQYYAKERHYKLQLKTKYRCDKSVKIWCALLEL